MSVVLVSALLSIVIIAVLLMHMVSGFVASGRKHREEIEKEKKGGGGSGDVVGGEGMRRRKSVKRVRFDDVEERVIVDRCEVFAELSGSEIATVVEEVESLGSVVEDFGGYEGVGLNAVVESRDFEEVSEIGEVSGLMEKGVELNNGGGVIENDVNICLSEETCSVTRGGFEELFAEEGKEIQCMDVEDVDGGSEEMEEELTDEVADRIEKYMRENRVGRVKEENCVNEGCNNEFEEAEEPKFVADHLRKIESGAVEESCVTEECKNMFKDAADPKDVVDNLRSIEGGVVEENRVIEERKNEFEEAAAPKVVADYLINTVGREEFNFNDGCKKEYAESEVLKEGVIAKQFEINEEDDWEGIEMSELYNDFTAAAAFVRKEEANGRLDNIGSEVKMQLYGFQKIVMEGPCQETQPMALKMSARAKWNAWQRLGNMNPDDAMKQYIALVAVIKPDWGKHTVKVDDPDQSEKPHFLLTSQRIELACNDEGSDTGSASPEFQD